jgi:hypothetical protein
MEANGGGAPLLLCSITARTPASTCWMAINIEDGTAQRTPAPASKALM